jgi:hypothetical protein
MRFELPSEIELLRGVVAEVAGDVTGDKPEGRYRALNEVGVFDLHTASSEHAELAAVVALDTIARSGNARGPWIETMLGRRLLGDSAGDTAVTAPSGAPRDGQSFLPFGMDHPNVLVAAGGGGARVETVAGGARPARVPNAKDGHAWGRLADDARALADIDAPFVWRAGAATCLGYSAALLDRAAEHAKVRTQFGKPIASFQAIEARLAESLWRIEGLRLIVREAGWRADRRDARADALSAMAWLYAREVSRQVARHAHQVFGAIGFTDEFGTAYIAGAAALLRTSVPDGPAVERILADRVPVAPSAVPPSTILGGFRQEGA